MRIRLRWTVTLAAISLVTAILIALVTRVLVQRAASSVENVTSLLVDAPCLADVCPGMSDIDQALETLSQHSLLTSIHYSESMQVSTGVFEVNEGGLVFVRFRQGELQTINIDLAGRSFPLEDVLEVLGKPSHSLLVYEDCGHGAFISASIFFREGIQVDIWHEASRQEKAKARLHEPMLLSGLPIAGLIYFEADSYDEWLANVHDQHDLYAEVISPEALRNAIQPWPGIDPPQTALELCSP